MSTFGLGRFGKQVVGLSRAPPLVSASTLPCGVPSRFARCRAFRSAHDDPGLGISRRDIPGSCSSLPVDRPPPSQTLLVCARRCSVSLFASVSLGVVQILPFIDMAVARPLPIEPRFDLRLRSAKTWARSALALSQSFDGLLRASACRFVAPCSRSWGSPCFRLDEGQLSCGFARRSVSRARSQVDPGGSGATSWLASLTLHRQKSRCRVRGFPRRGPCPSTPSHASFRRFRQPDWGVALPRVPSSRAQLLPVDVAVNQRCICAPDPVLLMRPDFLSSSFLSQWRFTLRRFLLSSSRVVSPRPLPSRAFISGTARVAASGPTFGAPHGVAPP